VIRKIKFTYLMFIPHTRCCSFGPVVRDPYVDAPCRDSIRKNGGNATC